MRNSGWKWLFACVAFCGIWVACSDVPREVLSEKKMQSVVLDMEIAEAMVGQDKRTFHDNATKDALYQSVFRKHGITEAVYDSSLMWYGRHLDIYMKVYERIQKEIERRQRELGDVQPTEVAVSQNDSVDIWSRRRTFNFEPAALFNGMTFDIRPESDFPSGSIFVWGMRLWGLPEHLSKAPVFQVYADQGDTTVFVRYAIRRDGYQEIVLRTVPTKRVKRVYGSFYWDDSKEPLYYKVCIDTLQMIRYNYGRLPNTPFVSTTP